MTQNTIRPVNQLIMALVRSGINRYDGLVNRTGISRTQIFWNVNNLKEEGLLTAETGTKGTLRLTEAGWEAIRQVSLVWERGKPSIAIRNEQAKTGQEVMMRVMEKLPFTDEPETA